MNRNARELVNRISRNTGKQWPAINKTLGSGTNGITFLTTNDPPRVLKLALGNATREVQALRKLQNSGSNFTPKIYSNYVNIRRNRNSNLINKLFPNRNNTNNTISAYVMNRVGNASLYKYVKMGHNTGSNKRQIKASVLKAIKFMHAHGISHGDLHAGNILVELDSRGRMKKLWVIDFGRYVNIQPGQLENTAYRALPYNRMFTNYNLFNAKVRPSVELRLGPSGPARRNMNVFNYMYEGYKKNASCGPFGCFRR